MARLRPARCRKCDLRRFGRATTLQKRPGAPAAALLVHEPSTPQWRLAVPPREAPALLKRFQFPQGNRGKKEDAGAAAPHRDLRVEAPRRHGCRTIPQPPLLVCRCTRRPNLSCRDRFRSGSGKKAHSPKEFLWRPSPSVALVADVEFELPALLAVTRYAPELERADFGYARLKTNRQNGSLRAVDVERHFERAELLDARAPVFQQVADIILLANGRTQEAELRRFANHQAKLSTRDFRLGALFHAEGHNAKRFQRSLHARHGRHSAFDPDVIRARGATADSDTLSSPRPAVVSRSARYGMIEIR